MGEARRRRKAYQHLHGGPLPPGEKPPEPVQLTILVTPALRDALEQEFETMQKPAGVTRQDFLEKLLFGGFKNYQQWKAQQAERGSIVKLATVEELQAVALEDKLHG